MRTQEGWSYLAVILDALGRRLVGWALNVTREPAAQEIAYIERWYNRRLVPLAERHKRIERFKPCVVVNEYGGQAEEAIRPVDHSRVAALVVAREVHWSTQHTTESSAFDRESVWASNFTGGHRGRTLHAMLGKLRHVIRPLMSLLALAGTLSGSAELFIPELHDGDAVAASDVRATVQPDRQAPARSHDAGSAHVCHCIHAHGIGVVCRAETARLFVSSAAAPWPRTSGAPQAPPSRIFRPPIS
jgi:hypothetical protein